MKENLYKKAAEIAKIGIWELDLANDKLSWNDITKSVYEVDLNHQPDLKEAESFYIQIPGKEDFSTRLQKVISTGLPEVIQFLIKTAKGNLKWVESHSLAEFSDGKCIKVLGSIQDITRQMELIESLAANQEKFFQVFDYAPIGMALVSPTGKWIKVNKSLCTLLGFSQEEFLPLTFQDITHPDDLDADLADLGRMLRKEIDSYSMDKRYFHKDGQIVWASLNVTLVWGKDNMPLYFISQILDITEKIKSTEVLLRERQRLSNIIKSTQTGTWEWNIQTNSYTSDERCSAMLGYTFEELFPKDLQLWQKLIHPDDVQHVASCLQESFKNKTDYSCEYRLKHKQGNWIWIEAHGMIAEWGKNGEPVIMLGTRADISERKKAAIDQEITMDIISDQNKRLVNFAHIVSHNLRSHAGNFQMMFNLLKTEEDQEEKDMIIGLLEHNANNLSDTIHNLNEVVDIQLQLNQKTKSLNLNDQIWRILESIKGISEKHKAEFILNVDPQIRIEYNPAYLESILLNFLTNAIKYSHPDRIPEITISACTYPNETILEIKDNGLGIDLKLHGEKLFGMYKTFHEHADARGIGLFITKNQIESMGGKIEVESEVGTGTTFKIHILNRPE